MVTTRRGRGTVRNAETPRDDASRAEQVVGSNVERQQGVDRREREVSVTPTNRNVNEGASDRYGLNPILAMLTQVLERLPAATMADEALPRREEMPGERVMPRADTETARNATEVAGQASAIPSYLKMMDHMQKLGTKFFSGGDKPIEADEWRSRLERNFNSIRCPDEYRCDLAVHYLEGDAHNWWKGVLSRVGSLNCTWETFSNEFQAKYFPPEVYDRLESAFLDLSQKSMTVREYETQFHNLKRYGGRELDDEKVQVRRFMRGLRLELRNVCQVRSYNSVAELVEKAAQLESGLEEVRVANEKKRGPAVHQTQSGQGSGSRQRKTDGHAPNKSVAPRVACVTCGRMHLGECRVASGACFRCGGSDHRVRDCPKEDPRSKEVRTEGPRVCYNCGEAGHIRANCPKPHKPSGKRPREELPPPPPSKRSAITPRAYSLVADPTEKTTTRPITGKF